MTRDARERTEGGEGRGGPGERCSREKSAGEKMEEDERKVKVKGEIGRERRRGEERGQERRMREKGEGDDAMGRGRGMVKVGG